MEIVLALAIIVPIIAIIATAIIAIKKRMNGASPRKAVKANIITVAALVVCLAGCAIGAYAANSPQDAATNDTSATQEVSEEAKGGITDKGIQYLAACLSTGIGAIGGGIAVAAGAPAAIGAATEDPKSFGKSIIFVALGESIALYGVVISILILFT